MSPKFRGDSEDWLDEEEGGGQGSGPRRKRKPARSAEVVPALEESNAMVIEVHPKLCRVQMDEDKEQLICSFRRSSVERGMGEARERTFVTVGDRVVVSSQGAGAGVVEGVCERRNALFRVAPGGEGKKTAEVRHVIAANLDCVVIVASVRDPEFSPGLVDRFLIGTLAAGIEPLICVTKQDLAVGSSSLLASLEVYRKLGYSVLEVSAKTGKGIEELKEKLLGRAVLFCGKSGVGKTSLLRTLLEAEVGKVGEVSWATGKGRHTTTGTVLFEGPGSSQWIDSPGVREFGLVGVEPERLADFFPEIRTVRCRAVGCLHSGEEGCEATALPRYSSYLRIFESLRAGEH